MKKILMFMAAGLLLFSCKEEPIPGHPYDGPDYVYFTKSDLDLSINWLIAGRGEIKTDGIPVAAVGGVYDTPREFKVTLVPTSNRYKNINGVYEDINIGNIELPPASMYKITDLVIPAGETTGTLGFSFLEDFDFMEKNKGKSWGFDMVITPNDNFEVWKTGDIDNDGKMLVNVRIEIEREYND